jgi:murein DD-endopeptidase MepM/ murein hydrolase activator NlpD
MKEKQSGPSYLAKWLGAVAAVLLAWGMGATWVAVDQHLKLRDLEARPSFSQPLRQGSMRGTSPGVVLIAASTDGAAGTAETASSEAGAGVCRNRAADPAELSNDPARLGPLQRDLVARLAELAASNIAQLETTIRMAGLDPAEVIPPRQPQLEAAGGPYVAPGDGRGEGGGLVASLAALNVHLDRWDELKQAIGALPLREPLRDYQVDSPFGWRIDPFLHRPAIHEGIDLVAPLRTPVAATAGGRVVFAGVKPGFGRVVELDHGHNVRTIYGHLQNTLVHAGQVVAAGARIGRVGNSGRSTGPHLHYEIRVAGVARDPAQFLYTGRLILAGSR